uniref:Vertnin n=1 Tax=Geotrypetes seraphini TaxID=260995 RepID=A0A6P8RNV4_GEOSA|nr:vertnin isoform X2 [Geotrypetes seraphini]
MRNPRMILRQQLVECVLQELQEATECFGLERLTSAAVEAEKMLSSFSLPHVCTRYFQGEMEVDLTAKNLYPEDAPRNMLPLTCKGEGNHLFEAASILLWGNPSLSMELQVRTSVEMLLHRQYYLKGMIDSKVMLQAARFSLCTEESAEMLNLPFSILEAIYDADIKATCFPGTFANMWHVYALASVLHSNIYSIYPMSNLKIRPYFNRLIRPRKCEVEVTTLHIMWSGQRLSRLVFKPQYFVPVVGLEELEPTSPPVELRVQPVKTLELLNSDPLLTYSNLREKYSITKSTFYRWKRQSQEHRKKAATRYEAKHFLQACFQNGDVVPLQHFRQLFPEISRSTYYAWKHEMLQSAFNGHPNPAPRILALQQFTTCCQESVPTDLRPKEIFSLDIDRNGICMQGAKKYLERCIAMNTLLPYRTFKRSFPGISRSTYYNWRRKAIKKNLSFQIPQEASIYQEVSTELKPYLSTVTGHLKIEGDLPSRKGKYLSSIFHLPSPLYIQTKMLRHAAKRHVQKWHLPFCKFRLQYPRISATTYWFWNRTKNLMRKQSHAQIDKSLKQQGPLWPDSSKKLEDGVLNPVSQMDETRRQFEKRSLSPYNATISRCTRPEHSPDTRMFVMDVIATAQFKAQAKLFLQQRFASKTFPSYKEFNMLFPHTARSTYYMWKRALHEGLTLVDA